MGMLKIYDWGLPNQSAHLNGYKGKESLYNAARALWGNLDSAGIYFFVICIGFALVTALYYYYGYNKLPGRKYKISHWGIWLGITVLVTFIFTMVFGNILVSSSLSDKVAFILRISLINGLYASVIYFIASFIICNLPLPTNAYRFLKLGK